MSYVEQEERSITRRGFLKGAAAGAAGLAAAGVLSGCGSTDVPECPECEPCPTVQVSEAAPEESEATKPIPPVDPPDKWDKEADFVVVGAGGAGLVATLKALDKGNSVICLEKMQTTGGATQYATGCILYGTRVQERAGYVVDEEEYEKLYNKFLIQSNYTVDQQLLRAMLHKSGEFGNWMEDLGYEFEPFVGGAPLDYHMPKGGRNKWIGLQTKTTDWLRETIGSRAEILVNTQTVALVRENGRIVGVQAESQEEPLFVKAKKAVILAAGGFCNNRDMLKKYIPAALHGCGSTYDMPSSTGETVRMGIGAGADMAGYNSYNAFDGGIAKYDMGVGPWYSFLYSGDSQITRQPWLNVNKNAERFTWTDNTQKMYKARIIASAPGGRVYPIWDGKFEERFPAIESPGCAKPVTPDLPGMDDWDERISPKDWHVPFNEAVAKGAIKKADTIEGLAEALGLDPVRLKKTVDEWNSLCARGQDPALGQAPPFFPPVEVPPFYGAETGGQLHVSACGLRVNPQMQVIDTKGEVIPGLYAAFHTAGGGNGWGQIGSSALSSCGLAYVGGYMAGESAADEQA